MSVDPEQITVAELKAHRKSETERIWRDAYALQKRLLASTIAFADETTQLFLSGSGAALAFVYICALKSKDGKKILSYKTPDIEELERLGYQWT